MTTLADELERVVAIIKSVKEDDVRRGNHESPWTILCFRGDEAVAIVQLLRAEGSKDLIAAAHIAAAGFDADLMVTHYETWLARTHRDDPNNGLNPLTGQKWRPNEMQDLVDNHDGIAKGWITDSVSATVVNRAGDIELASLPFRTEGRRVIWEDVAYSTNETIRAGGLVVDSLVGIMESPTISTQMAHVLPESIDWVGTERAIAIRDIMTAKYLVNPPVEHVPPCIVALQAKPGSVREQTLKERGKGAGIRVEKLK